MLTGLSIPTSLASLQWLASQGSGPPGWLIWLSTPRDSPLLVLLALVLLAFGLGRAVRRS